MIPEEKLAPAEGKVLAAFRAGKPGWPVKGEIITGDFLRGLFLGYYEERNVADYRGTVIVGARISDALNMEFCETKFPVRFRECVFADEIKLQQLTCPELDFEGCTLKKGLDATHAKVAGNASLNGVIATAQVSLAGADIGGQLSCVGGSFQNEGGLALFAQNIRVASDVFLRGGFNAEGAVSLAGADIKGQLACVGGSFQNKGGRALFAQDIKVAGGVFLRGEFKAVGAVSLAGADIGGQLDCEGGSFQNEGKDALFAQGIKVAGSVFLSGGFNAEGAVRLSGADIGGHLACEGGSFQNEGKDALFAQDIKVAGNVFLNTDDSDSDDIKMFKAEGEVRLAGADIKGQLACVGGSFQNKGGRALNAQGIKVAGSVFLSGGFNAEGAVSLSGADIGGQLACVGGSFQNKGGRALFAQDIKVAGGVFLSGKFNAEGAVYFANATIGGNLVLKNCKLTHLSLAGANVSGEFQDDAKVYKKDQGGDIDLDIDGFRYQRLEIADDKADLKGAAVKKRIEWAGLMSKGDEFRPQPYEQLMQVYRATGHTNWARDAGFALEKKRQQAMKSRWWKCWYWVLRLTIGYGYRPFRFFGWFFGIILFGTAFSGGWPCSPDSWRASVTGITAEASKNHWGRCEFLRMHPTHAEVVHLDNGQPGEIQRPKNYPRLIPLLYAAETAFPLFPLGQTGNWHPATWWVKFIQWLITLLGTLALAILALYGAGLLGPRWRDK